MSKFTRLTIGAVAIILAAGTVPASHAASDRSPMRAQQRQLAVYQQAVAKSFGPTPGGLAGPVVPVIPAGSIHASRSEGPSQSGFHWDDAGIGAAVMLVLLGAGRRLFRGRPPLRSAS